MILVLSSYIIRISLRLQLQLIKVYYIIQIPSYCINSLK